MQRLWIGYNASVIQLHVYKFKGGAKNGNPEGSDLKKATLGVQRRASRVQRSKRRRRRKRRRRKKRGGGYPPNKGTAAGWVVSTEDDQEREGSKD